jgi:hypothetical protein
MLYATNSVAEAPNAINIKTNTTKVFFIFNPMVCYFL